MTQTTLDNIKPTQPLSQSGQQDSTIDLRTPEGEAQKLRDKESRTRAIQNQANRSNVVPRVGLDGMRRTRPSPGATATSTGPPSEGSAFILPKEQLEQPPVVVSNPSTSTEAQPIDQQQEQKKPGFFARMFGKK